MLASYDPDYKAIVALAPSSVVWQGFPKDFSKIMESPSSWSKDGKGLSFVPYISREEQNKLSINNRHAASLTNASAVRDALIKVEHIKSPILLLSGGEDKSWPSEEMANDICKRVGNNCTHKSYPEGDHLLSEHKNEMFAEVDKFLDGVR